MAERGRYTLAAVLAGGVILDGWALIVVDRALNRGLPDVLPVLDAAGREEAARAAGEIRKGADLARALLDVSDSGNAELPHRENPSRSARDAITTAEAQRLAADCGVPLSERRIRQLASACGGTQARRGAPWLLDRGLWLAHLEGRQAA